MQPRIENLIAKKLIGNKIIMSIANNRTGQLWGQFAPRIKEIANRTSTEKISMQIYPSDYYLKFSPKKEFVKWATVEVHDFENIPLGMESFDLIGGLYAVFDYEGSSADNRVFQYIYGTWLPNAAYQLDDRPHFEVLGAAYKNNNPNSKEEIWIPIKLKRD